MYSFFFTVYPPLCFCPLIVGVNDVSVRVTQDHWINQKLGQQFSEIKLTDGAFVICKGLKDNE